MVVYIPLKKTKTLDKKKMTEKLIFQGSAGWLLFWLIVAPPIGYIWLIFNMESEERKDE